MSEELRDGRVRVTCLDEDGHEESKVVERDDYMVVTTGRMHIAHVQQFSNGTTQLTLKLGEPR